MTATAYARITEAVQKLVEEHAENDPTVAAYMVARAGLLVVRGLRGSERAGEMAYRLADEFATERGE